MNASGAVIEFLSYEGVFTAVGGAAGGMRSVDVGVSENGSGSASPVTSIFRNPNGVWGGPQQLTAVAFDAANQPMAGVTVTWSTNAGAVATVDAVEALSGYDLLARLRDDIEIAVESGTVPPDAMTNGPWAAFAGDPLALSGAGSTDGDGDALTYAWTF